MTDAFRHFPACPRCGSPGPAGYEFMLALSTLEGHTNDGFRCPSCATLLSGDRGGHSPGALAPADEGNVPAEARERHEGPVIALDDLLDLVLKLAEEDDLARLAIDIAPVTRPRPPRRGVRPPRWRFGRRR